MWNKNFGKIRRLDVIFILIVLIKVILIRFFKGKLSALPPTFINEEESKTYEGDNAFETIETIGVDALFCPGYFVLLFNFYWTLDPFMSRFEFGSRTYFVI